MEQGENDKDRDFMILLGETVSFNQEVEDQLNTI